MISPLLYLGFGGLNGYYLLPTLVQSQNSLLTTLRQLPHHITAWHNLNMVILNPFIMTLHQRSYLVGLPVFLIVLHLSYLYLQKPTFKKLLALTSVGILLAFIHPHSWVSFLMILPTWAILTWVKRSARPTAQQLIFFAASLATMTLSGFLIIKSLQPSASVEVIQWQPGWRTPNLFDWPLFWLKNIGFYLPLGMLALLYNFRHNRPLAFLMIASLAPFVAGNLFTFAPWDWDNTKLFFTTWVIFSIGLGSWLGQVWSGELNPEVHKHSIVR